MTDEELIDVVYAMDSVAKSLERRFEGDDDALVKLMAVLECRQDVASKLLITSEVLRECVARGLNISRKN